MASSKIPAKPPVSCVGWLDSFIGLAVILGLFFTFRNATHLDQAEFSLLLIAGVGVVLGSIEIFRAPWLRYAPSNENINAILVRASVKMLGFIAGLAFIVFLYWLFPEYRRDYYAPVFDLYKIVAPFIIPFFVVYFLFAEWRFKPEHDGSWHAGMFVLGQWKSVDFEKLRQNILGWLVKGFFLPIMIGDLAFALPQFRYGSWDLTQMPFMEAFSLLLTTIINLELVFVSAGYALGCRLFDSHIRAVERTTTGWVSALITYGPFISLTFTRYFDYRGGPIWSGWLEGHPTLLIIWGSAILLLLSIHMWCDACFGVRFSNLTHRGIITNGCYRFSKHPAYVIKSIRWFLMFVPFANPNGVEGLRMMLIYVSVCLIYGLRAYCEERTLSRDPVYQEYALWMEEHGWLRGIGKAIPFMRYSWRLERWKKQNMLPALPTA